MREIKIRKSKSISVKKSLILLLIPILILACMSVNLPVANAAAGLPAHLLTGYWHNFDNGSTVLRLGDVPTTYTIVAVAFADATTTPGAVNFTLDSGISSKLGGYTEAQFINDIKTLQSRGQKVIISVGGQNGTISVRDSNSATNFANSIYSLMTKYGFDGVDIDLENGVDANYMGSALKQISSKAGPNLIITMAPQTIDMQTTGMEYFKLALNIKDILTICNMQYYNSGTMLGQDGKVYSQGTIDFLTALAAIQLEGGLRPDQVGLGLPATTQAAGGGYVAPSVVNNALDCLATGKNGGSYKPLRTYPGIRGAMTWSINWDAKNNYSWANTIYPFLKTLPGGNETSIPSSTNKPTSTPTPTPTPTNKPPVGNSISGYVKPDVDSTDSSIKAGFKVEIVGKGLSATTDNNGYFIINNVPSSSTAYTINVSKASYLTRTITNVPGTASISMGSQSAPVDIWAGDIIVDNVINMADIMEIAKGFNSVSGDGKYNVNYDVNKDGAVNMSDIMAVVKHFNKTTSDYPAVPFSQITPPPTATDNPTQKPTPTPTSNGTQAWDSNNHSYALGDKVSYSGSNYECIYAHASNIAWDPVSTTGILWKKI